MVAVTCLLLLASLHSVVSGAFLAHNVRDVEGGYPKPAALPHVRRASASITANVSATITSPAGAAQTCYIPTGESFSIAISTTSRHCSDDYGDPSINTYGQAYMNYANVCLRSHCYTSLSSFAAPGPTRLTITTKTRNSGIYGTGTLSDVIVSITQWLEIYTTTLIGAQAYIPSYPCCSICTLSAATIDMFFWDALTTSSALPITSPPPTYVSNGFTFTYPSVYLAFSSLGASDWCGPVGDMLYNTTVGFDPEELYTVMPEYVTETCFRDPNNPIDWFPLYTTPPPVPLTYADVAQNCSKIPGYEYFATAWYNSLIAGDPCHPIIALPSRIKNLQPAWADCVADENGGFYDPPKYLTAQIALLPTTTPPSPASSSTQAPSTSVPVESANDPTLSPSSPSPQGGSSTRPSSQGGGSNPTSAGPAGPGSTTIIIGGPPASQSRSSSRPPSSPTATGSGPARPAPVPDPSTPAGTPGPGSPPGGNGPPAPAAPTITVGGTTIVVPPVGSSTVLPDGQTLTAGGSTITVGGTPVAILPGGSSVVVGSSTQEITPVTVPPSITIGGAVVTQNAQSQFVFDGTTLFVGGGPITVSGTVYILTTNTIGQTELIVGPAPTGPPITIMNTVISAIQGNTYIISGSTLTPGGTVTLTDSYGGITIISLDPSGTPVVVQDPSSATPTDVTTDPPSPSVTGQQGPESTPTQTKSKSGGTAVTRLDSTIFLWAAVSLCTLVAMLAL